MAEAAPDTDAPAAAEKPKADCKSWLPEFGLFLLGSFLGGVLLVEATRGRKGRSK